MLAKVLTSALIGLDGVPIEVEIDIASQGLPNFCIVGLPDKAVEEAKERVRSAIRNSGADFPAKRITVNLAPADLPKEGPCYDLPIALGILIASEQLRIKIDNYLFIGELSLDGRVRSTKGILPHTILAQIKNLDGIFVPADNAQEASMIQGIKIYPVKDLLELFNHLSGLRLIEPMCNMQVNYDNNEEYEMDMQDIKGQQQARRALEIAAAGGHNILLKGPPGAGKTLLARTLPSILPVLTFNESVEVTKIYSIAGMLAGKPIIKTRPFRSPHHTTSLVGLIGGSSNPRPGEITLAHRGVLFLDEFPEYPRNVLEALRQPIEDGIVTISRATAKITFPAKCMLVAAQNPCPCGYLGDPNHDCKCLPTQIMRYQKRVSGPLLDRIDIHLTIPAVKVEKLTERESDVNSESSRDIRNRVQLARNLQTSRFKDSSITSNAEMSNKMIKEYCALSETCLDLLRSAINKLHLSGRSYHRIIKLSRTIADLAGSEEIKTSYIAEALQYRPRVESS